MKANKLFFVVIAVFFDSNSKVRNFDISSTLAFLFQRELMQSIIFLKALLLTKFQGQRIGIERYHTRCGLQGKKDFLFRLKLKITLVESTYPSQRP